MKKLEQLIKEIGNAELRISHCQGDFSITIDGGRSGAQWQVHNDCLESAISIACMIQQAKTDKAKRLQEISQNPIVQEYINLKNSL